MKRKTTRAILLGLGMTMASVGYFSGCALGDGAADPRSGSGDESTGRVGLKLTLPGGETIGTISYAIHGPHDYAGTVDVTGASSSFRFVIPGVAPGSGYTITLTATTVDGAVSCAGVSSPFSVQNDQTTLVNVLLACTTTVEAGAVLVNGVGFPCASWHTAVANPATTTPGGTISLVAWASGPDPSAITYQWSASNGTLTGATSANATFTCPATAGDVTITLTVGDGPVPDGGACPADSSTTTLTVTCAAPGDAAVPDAAGDASPDAALPGTPAPWITLPAGYAVREISTAPFPIVQPGNIAVGADDSVYIGRNLKVYPYQTDVIRVRPSGDVSQLATFGAFIGGLAIDSAGRLFGSLADSTLFQYENGVATTFATGLPAGAAEGVALDAQGNLYVAYFNAQNVMKVSPAGVPSTFVSGLGGPFGVTFANGVLYVGDNGGNGNGPGYVDQIDSAGHIVHSMGPVSGRILDLRYAVGPQFSGFFVTNQDTGAVEQVTDGGLNTFATGFHDGAWSLAFAPDGSMYVVDGSSLYRFTATGG